MKPVKANRLSVKRFTSPYRELEEANEWLAVQKDNIIVHEVQIDSNRWVHVIYETLSPLELNSI